MTSPASKFVHVPNPSGCWAEYRQEEAARGKGMQFLFSRGKDGAVDGIEVGRFAAKVS